MKTKTSILVMGWVCLLALAAPARGVDVSDFLLDGGIEGENARFTLSFQVEAPREGGRLLLVEGDVALLDAQLPGGAELEREGQALFARFDARWFGGRTGSVRVTFTSRVVRTDAERRTGFLLPDALVRRVVFRSGRDGLDVRLPLSRVTGDEADGSGGRLISAVLVAGKPFLAVWKPDVPVLTGDLAASCDARIVALARVGALQVQSEFQYAIAQGQLQRLTFVIPPGLSVTQVAGADLRSWHVDAGTGGEGRLVVALSRPQTSGYALTVTGETVLPDFPATFDVPVPVPEDVIRTSGFLALGTDSAIRLVVTRAAGLTQMDPAAFPAAPHRGGAAVLPGRSLHAYQFASMPVQAAVSADDVVAVLHVEQRLVCSLEDDELVLAGPVVLDVRDAPVREMRMLVPAEWMPSSITGPNVADVEVRDAEGARAVLVFFREPVLGHAMVDVRLERTLRAGESAFDVPSLRVEGARSERGFIALRAEPGIRLDPRAPRALREVHTGSLPQRVPDAQHAFRFRDGDWAMTVDVHRETPSIHAEVFHLAAVGEGSLYGSSSITYAISGAPVRTLRLTIADAYQNVEITGRDVRGFRREEDAWVVSLQERVIGDYTLLVTYTEPVAYEGGGLLMGGVRTLGTESESGYLVLSGAAGLEVEAERERDAGVLPVTQEEIPREYALLVSDTVLRAWKYVGAPHRVRVAVRRHAAHPLVGQIADHVALTTRLSAEGEAVTEARIFVKNTSGQHLAFRLPDGATLWSVRVDEEDVRALEDGAGRVLVPIERRRDPNQPIAVRVVYAEQREALGVGRRVAFSAPVLDTRSVFSRWTFDPPQDYRFLRASGTLASPAPAALRGLPALADRMTALGRWAVTRGLGWTLLAAVCIGAAVMPVFNAGRRRPWHATGFAGVLQAPILLLMLAIFLPDRFAAPPRAIVAPAGGAWSLTRPVTLSGGELEASLWTVRESAAVAASWLRMALGVALAAFLFAAGRRRPRLRSVARALAVLPLLWGITGIPGGWAWGGSIAAACIPLLLACGALRTAYARGRRRALRPERPPFGDEVSFLDRVPAAPTAGREGGARIQGLLALSAAAALVLHAAGAGNGPAPEDPGFDEVVAVVEAPAPDAGTPGDARVELRFAFEAERGAILSVPTGLLAVSDVEVSDRRLRLSIDAEICTVEVLRGGRHTMVLRGLLPVAAVGGGWSVSLPLAEHLRGHMDLSIAGEGLDVDAPSAVYALVREEPGVTRARFHFGAAREALVRWRPKQRATRLEQAVVFAEVNSVALCRPGLVAFTHEVRYQVAQGELQDLRVEMPAGVLVTAVTGPGLATWRFDPQTRLLDARLDRPVAGGYVLRVVAQAPRESLPYRMAFEAPTILDVERQRGSFAVATVEAVQITIEPGEGIAGMSVADFPAAVFEMALDVQVRTASPELRRAFRYHRLPAGGMIEADRVLPEIRVAEESSLDLTLERATLTTRLRLEVAKAGVFSVRLALPEGFDIDSLSGEDVSHWDEHREGPEPGATVHFARQALGTRTLNLVLSRMERGVADSLQVPRVGVRDAVRQTGTLAVTGERGLRLSTQEREGVSELNPRDLGVRAAVPSLAFRLLRPDWSVTLRVDVTEPVVKAEVLQRVDVSEGMLQVRAFIQYAIEQAGVKTFRLRAPRPGVGLTLSGRHIARVREIDPETGLWEVELNGRVEEAYALEAVCSLPFEPSADRVRVTGIEPVEIESVRGFLVVFAGGRLHVAPQETPPELRPDDPRGVPGRFGAGDLSGAALAYRVTRVPFVLDLAVIRHDSADVLSARVESVRLTTVVAEDEQRMTRVEMDLRPGSLRLLEARLPEGAEIWSAFVNERAVRPMIQNDVCLVPVSADAEGRARIELTYGDAGRGARDRRRRQVVGPTFNLPLQDVEWTFYLPPGRRYGHFEGTLTPRDEGSGEVVFFSAAEYEAWNRALAEDSLRKAEQVLERGQAYWREGRPEDARRAMQDAVTYSRGQVDLNEDARIQYRNLVRQQAVVGLATRRAALRASRNVMAGEDEAQLRAFREGDWDAEHGRQIAQQLGAAETESLGQVAERLFDQQEAAEAEVHPIRVTIPLQGRRQVFTRALHVQEHGELTVSFRAVRTGEGRPLRSAAAAGGLALLFIALFRMAFGRGAEVSR